MPRILVVDDHQESRRLFEAILRHAGHDVVAAADGREGLEMYRRQPADLAIIDIFMPVMDGIEVISELRQEFPRARIIAVSAGWQELDLLPQAEALGANRSIRKPFDPDGLVQLVEEVLRGEGRGAAAGGPEPV